MCACDSEFASAPGAGQGTATGQLVRGRGRHPPSVTFHIISAAAASGAIEADGHHGGLRGLESLIAKGQRPGAARPSTPPRAAPSPRPASSTARTSRAAAPRSSPGPARAQPYVNRKPLCDRSRGNCVERGRKKRTASFSGIMEMPRAIHADNFLRPRIKRIRPRQHGWCHGWCRGAGLCRLCALSRLLADAPRLGRARSPRGPGAQGRPGRPARRARRP